MHLGLYIIQVYIHHTSIKTLCQIECQISENGNSMSVASVTSTPLRVFYLPLPLFSHEGPRLVSSNGISQKPREGGISMWDMIPMTTSNL